jgi:ubiquinone/menaquinone biosynthesis C-methylase UbiE
MKKSRLLTLLVLFVGLSATTACSQSSDVDLLINILNIEQGDTVADIGAGDGDQTIGIARHLGPDGQIYSTELGTQRLKTLRKNIEQTQVNNIEIIEGAPAATNLPKECCSAVYMRRVYHHIDAPATFNASLFATVKPGGRLAIIDFRPDGSEAEPENRDQSGSHGVTPETVIEELTSAGFQLVNSDTDSGRHYHIVMQKPTNSSEE